VKVSIVFYALIILTGGCSLLKPKPPKKIMWKQMTYFSGRDSLRIEKGKKSQLEVEVLSRNPVNGDTCELNASFRPIIVDSEYEWKDAESSCEIKLRFEPKVVVLQYAHDCQAFCGLRAQFPENFMVRPETCDEKSIKDRKKKVKVLIAKRTYLAAADAYEGILVKCGDFLDLSEKYSLINDQANALWRSGDIGGCRKTLKPVAHWVGTEDDVGQIELDHIKGLRKEINYTWKMCHLGSE
jgi:hypothetical protein